MFITRISPNNYQNKYYNTEFRSRGVVSNTVRKSAPNILSWNTIKELKSAMSAFKAIKAKLNSLSEEGIKYIEANYPDISIGESLIFHNCGDKKSSILVRSAESLEYSGLSRIIERKGNSTWSERIVLNSFLIDNDEKLLVNEDENKQKNFPKERVYLSQAEVEQNKLEPALQSVVADLDFALLKFRKFLATVGSDYEKTPDGVLPYNIVSMFRDIQKYQKEIDLKLANLPKKVELSLRKSFPNYKLITGLTTHAFGDLGKEQITLTYNPILAPEMENYRRLNVFDKDDNLLKTFVVSTNGKMVSNLNPNSTTHLPRKLSFVDANKLEEEDFGPSFQKYLVLYHSKLKELFEYIEKFSLERLKYMNSVPLEMPNAAQTGMSEVLENMTVIDEMMQQLPGLKALGIKKSVPNLYIAAGSRGVTFDGFMGDKKVYLLTINSKRHDNLTKLSIIDEDGSEKFYVIKDLKHIVKNINPQYPQMMPKTLVFLKEADADIEPEVVEAINYLQEKVSNYKKIVQQELDNVAKEKAAITREKELKKEAQQRAIEENKKCKELKIQEQTRLREERIRARKEILSANRLRAKNIRLEAQREKAEQSAETMRRKGFIDDCKSKLAQIKQNINSSSDEFRKQLEELKRMTEEFINNLN